MPVQETSYDFKNETHKKVRIGIVEDDRITRMFLVEMINRQAELEIGRV